MIAKVAAAVVSLAALVGAGLGVWTQLDENRIAARKAYTDGLAATETTYRALNERMIAVEARLDVLMHSGGGHGGAASAPIVDDALAPLADASTGTGPREPRRLLRMPPAKSIEAYRAARTNDAPTFEKLMERK